MRTISDFIEKLGGAVAVAANLEIPYTTVASWKARGAIPVEHWAKLIGAARERGLECDSEKLRELHVAPSPEPAPKAEATAP